MKVSDLLILLAKQKPDATVYLQDPATDDQVPVSGLERHQGSVVLKADG